MSEGRPKDVGRVESEKPQPLSSWIPPNAARQGSKTADRINVFQNAHACLPCLFVVVACWRVSSVPPCRRGVLLFVVPCVNLVQELLEKVGGLGSEGVLAPSPLWHVVEPFLLCKSQVPPDGSPGLVVSPIVIVELG